MNNQLISEMEQLNGQFNPDTKTFQNQGQPPMGPMGQPPMGPMGQPMGPMGQPPMGPMGQPPMGQPTMPMMPPINDEDYDEDPDDMGDIEYIEEKTFTTKMIDMLKIPAIATLVFIVISHPNIIEHLVTLVPMVGTSQYHKLFTLGLVFFVSFMIISKISS